MARGQTFRFRFLHSLQAATTREPRRRRPIEEPDRGLWEEFAIRYTILVFKLEQTGRR